MSISFNTTRKNTTFTCALLCRLTENAAAHIDIACDWKPGSPKDDGKRAGSEKGFRQ